MQRRKFLFGSSIAVPAALAGYWFWPRTPTEVPPQFSDEELDSIRAAVNPAPGEDLFAEIPWQTSLWDARRLAAKDGKPILLWEMDGHPLGCG